MVRKVAFLFTSVVLLSAAERATAQLAAAPSVAALQPPSSLVQPALDSVARAGSTVDLNHWKGSGAARDEVDGNLLSMQKDLQTTLPPLLAAADAAPASAAASLPVLLNLDALYSVLLRVTIASRTAAPRNENTALEQAAVLLDGARRSLGDAVLASARLSEQQVTALQATVQRQQAALQQAQQSPAKPAATSKTKKRPASTTSAKSN